MAWSFYDQNGKVLQGVLAVSIGTTELATDAVTSVKILDANVTAAKMAVNSINSDQYVDRSIDTVHIGLNQVTLAEMAGGTDGNLITYDASGDPAYVVTGTAAQVLTSNGADTAPTFQAAGGVGLGMVIALGG